MRRALSVGCSVDELPGYRPDAMFLSVFFARNRNHLRIESPPALLKARPRLIFCA
jgi:hypothetical protein